MRIFKIRVEVLDETYGPDGTLGVTQLIQDDEPAYGFAAVEMQIKRIVETLRSADDRRRQGGIDVEARAHAARDPWR